MIDFHQKWDFFLPQNILSYELNFDAVENSLQKVYLNDKRSRQLRDPTDPIGGAQ